MQTDHEIALDLNPIVRKLMRSFMQFNKTAWHQRAVAGCKPSEIRVLFCVRRGTSPDVSEIKVSEISKLLHVTSPTVTQLLKGLEANGLIERRIDPLDRRAVGVRLTEKGGQVTRQAMDDMTRSLQGLIEFLGEEESNQLVELLSKVFQYFSEQEANVQQSHWNGDEEA
ncbi:MAG TPA: MarR family winged helix-turn-helix transcriptional regulator [Ktedonobacteraceae bacterium]|nr:MarR family winged helix-turn-helix transcriptional regulator [Ktedonobacteraceae bacterium]